MVEVRVAGHSDEQLSSRRRAARIGQALTLGSALIFALMVGVFYLRHLALTRYSNRQYWG